MCKTQTWQTYTSDYDNETTGLGYPMWLSNTEQPFVVQVMEDYMYCMCQKAVRTTMVKEFAVDRLYNRPGE